MPRGDWTGEVIYRGSTWVSRRLPTARRTFLLAPAELTVNPVGHEVKISRFKYTRPASVAAYHLTSLIADERQGLCEVSPDSN